MPERAEELWEDYLCGRVDDSSACELLAWLNADADADELSGLRAPTTRLLARRKEAAVSAGLDYLLRPASTSRRLAKSVLARIEGTRAGEESGRFRRRVMESLKGAAASADGERKVWRREAGVTPALRETATAARRVQRRRREATSSLWVAAAAALVIGAILLALSAPKKQQETAVAPQPVVPLPVTPKPEVQKTPPKVVEAPAWGALALQQGSATIDNKPLTGSVSVKVGQHVELAENSRAELTLDDGTALQIAENTKIDLLDTLSGHRVALKHGSAEIHAAKQAEGKTFTVETPHARVKVLGTKYSVQAFERFSRVAVESGKVEVAATTPETATAKSQLSGGEEVIVHAKGLEAVRQSTSHRIIALGAAENEVFTDQAVRKNLNEQFRGMALERLTYSRPKKKDAFGYSGITFPIQAVPGEDTFDVWIRPKSIKLEKPEYRLMKIAMLAQLGSTEYRIGAIEIYQDEKDWVVLRGRLSNASVHWVETGTRQIPLRAEAIQHIALRTEIGEIEYDHTGIIVWRDSAGK